jgi:hypothetical protein
MHIKNLYKNYTWMFLFPGKQKVFDSNSHDRFVCSAEYSLPLNADLIRVL